MTPDQRTTLRSLLDQQEEYDLLYSLYKRGFINPWVDRLADIPEPEAARIIHQLELAKK